jgi:hypothetical protein
MSLSETTQENCTSNVDMTVKVRIDYITTLESSSVIDAVNLIAGILKTRNWQELQLIITKPKQKEPENAAHIAT